MFDRNPARWTVRQEEFGYRRWAVYPPFKSEPAAQFTTHGEALSWAVNASLQGHFRPSYKIVSDSDWLMNAVGDSAAPSYLAAER